MCRKWKVYFFFPFSPCNPFFFPPFFLAYHTWQLQMKAMIYCISYKEHKNAQRKRIFCYYYFIPCSRLNCSNQLILLIYKYKINRCFGIQNNHHNWSDNAFIIVNDFSKEFSALDILKAKKKIHQMQFV